MTATKTRKLTANQARSLEIIRTAVPSELNEVGELWTDSRRKADGSITTRNHRAGTLESLADRGLIEAIAISRNCLADVVKFVGSTGERVARVEASPPTACCVCWVVRIFAADGRDLGHVSGRDYNRECYVEVPVTILARIREIMTANGWSLAD